MDGSRAGRGSAPSGQAAGQEIAEDLKQIPLSTQQRV